MEMKKYMTPEMELVDLEIRQILCASGKTGDDEAIIPGQVDDDDEP